MSATPPGFISLALGGSEPRFHLPGGAPHLRAPFCAAPRLSTGTASASSRRSRPATCTAGRRRPPLPPCSSRPSRFHTYLGTQDGGESRHRSEASAGCPTTSPREPRCEKARPTACGVSSLTCNRNTCRKLSVCGDWRKPEGRAHLRPQGLCLLPLVPTGLMKKRKNGSDPHRREESINSNPNHPNSCARWGTLGNSQTRYSPSEKGPSEEETIQG